MNSAKGEPVTTHPAFCAPPSPPTATASLCAKRIGSLRALRKDLVTLTGEKKSGAILGKATAWKTGSGELATLKADLDKANKTTLAANFKTMADKAVSDGKLPPAVRKVFEAHAETRGIEFAMECLTAHIGATTAPIVSTTETAPPSHDTTMALATLSAGAQAEIAKLFPNLTVEEAAKTLQIWNKQMPKVLAARAE